MVRVGLKVRVRVRLEQSGLHMVSGQLPSAQLDMHQSSEASEAERLWQG